MNNVVRAKMETIAAMRIAGSKLAEIAQATNMTVAGITRILSLPDYAAIETAKLQSYAGKIGQVLDDKAKRVREIYDKQNVVPEALKGIIEVAQQRKDLRAALKANEVLLDRDPNRTLPNTSGKDAGANAAAGPQGNLSPEFLNVVATEADAVKTKVN